MDECVVASRILGSLFNDKVSSDLVLVVGDIQFFVHRQVMMHYSGMIRCIIEWPIVDNNDNDSLIGVAVDRKSPEPSSIQLDLPEIDVPAVFATKSQAPSALIAFKQYLHTLYTFENPATFELYNVAAVAIIANYMQSEAVTNVCDSFLQLSIQYSMENWQDVLSFGKKNALGRLQRDAITFLSQRLCNASTVAGRKVGFSVDISRDALDQDDFKRLLPMVTCDAILQFKLLLNYASRARMLTNANILDCSVIMISGDSMIDLLEWGYRTIGPCWTEPEMLLYANRITNSIRLGDTARNRELLLGSLSKIVLQRCIRLIERNPTWHY